MGIATLAWHGLWQCLLSAPVRAKNTGSWGYTHCLEKGTTRLAVNRDRGLGFMFPAGHSLPELSPGLAQHLQTLSPCLFSSPASECLSLTRLFLPISCGCFFSDSPSSSQEHRVSGIGKPILRSSSDPPVNSRCPKPEEPTPSPSPPLKRQVGLLPVDAVLVKPEGTLIQRGGVHSSLCTPRRAEYRFSGKADTT